MCGILGIIASAGATPSVDDAAVIRMRDTLARRGPDDAGLWRRQNAILAHRRLSVLDTTAAGHQPMLSADGRLAISYNGELYNDAELRERLQGVRFVSTSDTETILELLAREGPSSLDLCRGMHALGLWDAARSKLILARDPLGIKPLYYARVSTPQGVEIVFASEIRAILAHPHLTPRPDVITAASYMTTIRTTLGERTLFEGVRCVQPGEILEFDAAAGLSMSVLRKTGWLPKASPDQDLREAVEESVRVHLRSDVPICALLSGGLDSSIVARVAMDTLGTLHTFCSGAPGADPGADDFSFARQVAGFIGSQHTEAPVTRELFLERWPEMVRALGSPLSTPNEVAINQVARTLRSAGKTVTLSGEGADELFAGYQLPMEMALAHEQTMPASVRRDAAACARSRAEFQITSNAWMNPAAAGQVLSSPVLGAIEDHAVLRDTYQQIASDCALECDHDPSGLQTHLSFHRRVNLVGLLQRLDTATMLESVEGRTPFADADLAALSVALPIERKFHKSDGLVQTKLALREAFARVLLPEVVARPKASFPLPFQGWIGGVTPRISDSAFARAFFSPGAITPVQSAPESFWPVAWPMTNLALWGQVWWG